MLNKYTVTYYFDEKDFVVEEMTRDSEGAVLFEVTENMNKRFFGIREKGGAYIEVATDKIRRFKIVMVQALSASQQPEVSH